MFKLLIFPSVLFIMVSVSGTAQGQAGARSGTFMDIGAGLDMTLETPLDYPEETAFELRAFELNLGAPVDPYFYFLTTIGFHDGEFDVEEAWVSAILPWNIKLQIGREMLPFGYLNRIHEHDFPQVDQPFVIENLLTDHGLIGDGGHLEWMAPFINPVITLNAGLYYSIEHSVGRRMGGNPYMLRAQSFFQNNSGSHAVLMGASYLGVAGDRDYAEGRESDARARGKIEHIASVDFKYKWSTGTRTYRGLTLAGEYFFIDYNRNDEHDIYDPELGGNPDLHPGSDQGLYAYIHWDFDRFVGLGYRFDLADVLFSSLEDERHMGHSVYVEWRGTEFSRIRLQYRMTDSLAGKSGMDLDHALLLQGTFFVGWHPPHRF